MVAPEEGCVKEGILDSGFWILDLGLRASGSAGTLGAAGLGEAILHLGLGREVGPELDQVAPDGGRRLVGEAGSGQFEARRVDLVEDRALAGTEPIRHSRGGLHGLEPRNDGLGLGFVYLGSAIVRRLRGTGARLGELSLQPPPQSGVDELAQAQAPLVQGPGDALDRVEIHVVRDRGLGRSPTQRLKAPRDVAQVSVRGV